jgi:hypothetical protein
MAVPQREKSIIPKGKVTYFKFTALKLSKLIKGRDLTKNTAIIDRKINNKNNSTSEMLFMPRKTR